MRFSAHSVGPNWIHGTDSNPILELAKTSNTTTGESAATLIMDETGTLLSPEEAEFCTNMQWDIIGRAFNHSSKNCDTISPDESFLDFFNRELVESIPETTPDYERKRKIMYQVSESFGAFVGNHSKYYGELFFYLSRSMSGV